MKTKMKVFKIIVLILLISYSTALTGYVFWYSKKAQVLLNFAQEKVSNYDAFLRGDEDLQ